MMMTPVSPIVLADGNECSLSPVSLASSVGWPNDIIEEQLVAMLDLEQAYRVAIIPCTAGDSMTDTSTPARLPYEEWRRKICEWCYKVVDHFRIDREVVGVALNFFDRYLVVHKTDDGSKNASTCRCPSCQRAVDSSTFQLGAMTALYLAIKLHAETAEDVPHLDEKPRRMKLRLHSFVELSRGQFSCEDIRSMERTMLTSLQWRVNPPTPMAVVSYLLRLMPKRSCIPLKCRYNYDLVLHVIHELSRYLTELSVCLAQVASTTLPSEVAYASILVAMDMLTVAALPIQVRDDFCEDVASVSSMSSQTDHTVRYLMERLRNCFSPDMLLDDCDMDKHHPISVARELGLMDMSLMYSTPTRKPGRKTSATSVMLHDQDMDESPMCVTP
jgi:Cyclin, N-terminal domain